MSLETASACPVSGQPGARDASAVPMTAHPTGEQSAESARDAGATESGLEVDGSRNASARDRDGSLSRTEMEQRRVHPRSLTWRYFGDRRLQLLLGRAGTTENMHPQLGQAVSDHSVIFTNLAERVQRSIPPIMTTVYGSADVAEKTGLRIRNFHKPLKGTVKIPGSSFDGTPYHGIDPATFYWAHATFLDQIYAAVERFIKPLTLAEKEQLFQESRDWFSMYGVDDAWQPETYLEFQEYWDRVVHDELEGGTKVAQYTVGYITKGITRAFPRPEGAPRWLWSLVLAPVIDRLGAFLGAGGLDPELRVKLGIEWTAGQDRRYRRFCAAVRAVSPLYERLVPLEKRYSPEAVEGFRREGVDPRSIHVRRGDTGR